MSVDAVALIGTLRAECCVTALQCRLKVAAVAHSFPMFSPIATSSTIHPSEWRIMDPNTSSSANASNAAGKKQQQQHGDATHGRRRLLLPDDLPPQFPSGEAAVTHIKRFCFATTRRVCRLERAKSGGNRKLLVCANSKSGVNRCAWFVSVSKSRKPNDRGWKVRDCCLDHDAQCSASSVSSSSASSSRTPDAKTIAHALLNARTNAAAIGIDADMSAKTLKAHIRATLDIDVKTRTLYRVKDKMLRVQDEEQENSCVTAARSSRVAPGQQQHPPRKSFQWIESLLQQFRALNPGSLAETQVDAENRFQRAIVIPKPHLDAVSNSQLQHAFAIETEPLESKWYSGIDVKLVGRDGNLQDFVIARAILTKNDKESYQWVMEKVRAAAGISSTTRSERDTSSSMLIFCDRTPGSVVGDAVLACFPSDDVIHSTDHLVSYLLREKLISETEEVLVRQAQAAEFADELRASLHNLRMYRPTAAAFLESMEPRSWAFCANLDRRLYGRASATPATKSAGNHGERDLAAGNSGGDKGGDMDVSCQSPFEYLRECMHAMMQGMFVRSELAKDWTDSSMQITPAAQRILEQEANAVDDYEVLPCNAEIVYVRRVSKESGAHRTRKVHLSEKTCTCTNRQQFGIPCRHIVAALKFAGKLETVHAFFDACYSVPSYADAFGNKFVQIPLEEDLLANPAVLPPLRAVPALTGGRPSKRKSRSESESPSSTATTIGQARAYRCSVCSSRDGHNRKTCPFVSR